MSMKVVNGATTPVLPLGSGCVLCSYCSSVFSSFPALAQLAYQTAWQRMLGAFAGIGLGRHHDNCGCVFVRGWVSAA